MTKKELVRAVAEKAGVRRDIANKTVDAVIEVVREALASGDQVRLVGFGTFVTRMRPAGKGRSFSGEIIEIPSRRVPAFRPGSELRKAVQG